MNRSNSALRVISGERTRTDLGGQLPQGRHQAQLPRPRIAFVVSEPGYGAAPLIPLLASLGITTLDRSFDERVVELVAELKPELVIAVCSTLGARGVAIVRALTSAGVERLLVLDANRSETGAFAALQLGADAVLAENAGVEVIRATLLALTRRTSAKGPEALSSFGPAQIRVGRLIVDHDACEIRESGEVVPLTPTEFRIVAHLAANAGKVQSARQIMFTLHDYQYSDLEAQQTVKVYVRRIRRKLDACSRPSVQVLNSRTFGYKLQPVANELSAGNVAA